MGGWLAANVIINTRQTQTRAERLHPSPRSRKNLTFQMNYFYISKLWVFPTPGIGRVPIYYPCFEVDCASRWYFLFLSHLSVFMIVGVYFTMFPGWAGQRLIYDIRYMIYERWVSNLFVCPPLSLSPLSLVSSQLTHRMIDEHCTAQLYACISYWSVPSVSSVLHVLYAFCVLSVLHVLYALCVLSVQAAILFQEMHPIVQAK